MANYGKENNSSDNKNNSGLLALGCVLVALGSTLLPTTGMIWIPLLMLLTATVLLGMYIINSFRAS